VTFHRGDAVKKGRHRRFEEARALKRSHDINLDELFDSLRTEAADGERESDAWSDAADDEYDDTYDEEDDED